MRRLFILPALLAAFAASPARAQDWEQYDYTNLAFSGGGVFLYGILPAHDEPALALQVRADLGLLGPAVRIVPSVTFWSSDVKESEIARVEDRVEEACERGGAPCPGIDLGEVSVSDLSIDVDAHFLWTTSYGVEPYAGLGVGIHLVNGRGDIVEGTFVEDVLDAISPGVNAMAGLELPLGPSLRLHGELRGMVAGNVRWIGAGVGGMFTFAQRDRRPPTATPPPPPPAEAGR
jgi:opacity protein-like surface antigen